MPKGYDANGHIPVVGGKPVEKNLTIPEQIEFMREIYRLMEKFYKLSSGIPERREVTEMCSMISRKITKHNIKQVAESLKELQRMKRQEKQREIEQRQERLL